MNLKELIEQLNRVSCELSSEELEKVIVKITTNDEGGVGKRPSVGVKHIYMGFDWEMGELRIESDSKIVKVVKNDK